LLDLRDKAFRDHPEMNMLVRDDPCGDLGKDRRRQQGVVWKSKRMIDTSLLSLKHCRAHHTAAIAEEMTCMTWKPGQASINFSLDDIVQATTRLAPLSLSPDST
jgi:hypothetical protein